MLKKGTIAFCVSYFIYIYFFSSHQDSPKELDNSQIMDTFKFEKVALLNEYISTSSFLVRQVKNHVLKPKDYAGIVSSLKTELGATVQGLRQEFQNFEEGPSKQSLVTYVEDVNAAVEKIPKFLEILSKHPNGNPELDASAAKILDELTKLRSGLIDLANALPNSSL